MRPTIHHRVKKGGFVSQAGPFEGARRLIRRCRFASLATLTQTGAPFVSLVAVASDSVGAPLMLLSELARHTHHLRRDGHAALLLDGSEGREARLAAPRLTLSGEAAPIEAAGDLPRRYLARHPDAAMLLELADFGFWRLCPAEGHLVEGFGRIATLGAGEMLVAPALAAALGAVEATAIADLHARHADEVALLAGDAGGRLVAIDADGLDLVAGGRPVRRDFAARLNVAEGLRDAIIGLVRDLRG